MTKSGGNGKVKPELRDCETIRRRIALTSTTTTDAVVEAHVHECDDCRSYRLALERVVAAVRTPSPSPDPTVEATLRLAVRQRSSIAFEPTGRHLCGRFFRASLAAAAVIGFMLVRTASVAPTQAGATARAGLDSLMLRTSEPESTRTDIRRPPGASAAWKGSMNAQKEGDGGVFPG